MWSYRITFPDISPKAAFDILNGLSLGLLRMPNAVFSETLGNVIPEDHSLQAQKSLLIYSTNDIIKLVRELFQTVKLY